MRNINARLSARLRVYSPFSDASVTSSCVNVECFDYSGCYKAQAVVTSVVACS